jgi:hypothetical protein
MAFRLILIWVSLAAIASFGAWLHARRTPSALWLRIGVAALLLVVLGGSLVASGTGVEKSLASISLYFVYVAAVFAGTGLCAGIVIGSLIALFAS